MLHSLNPYSRHPPSLLTATVMSLKYHEGGSLPEHAPDWAQAASERTTGSASTPNLPLAGVDPLLEQGIHGQVPDLVGPVPSHLGAAHALKSKGQNRESRHEAS